MATFIRDALTTVTLLLGTSNAIACKIVLRPQLILPGRAREIVFNIANSGLRAGRNVLSGNEFSEDTAPYRDHDVGLTAVVEI